MSLEEIAAVQTRGDRSKPRTGAPLTAEQEQAVARRGEPLLVAAGAGSGKTSVLVERFVRAVREDGVAPGRILAITFTERAAGELRERVRARFVELGEREAARDTEAAFVSTFHGFCARLLRAHPLPAELDPEFTILDEALAARLRGRAWARALGGFLEGERGAAVDLVAAWGADRVRTMVLATYAELRSRGERLPKLPAPGIAEAEPDDVDAEGARACALLDELLERFGSEYAALKAARDALDFDDLELDAWALLVGHERVRKRWSERFELMMVDEFQDTNPRQLAILGALQRENLFTVGDALQSIYGFRHADVSLFRARRDELAERGGSISLTRNFRGRKPLLDVVNAVFEERFAGGDYTALQAGRVEQEATDRAGVYAGSGAGSGAEIGAEIEKEPLVELLLTHKRGWDEDEEHAVGIAGDRSKIGQPSAPLWRQAEARLLAGRVAELVGSGAARAGEVAVLLRAVGDLEVYERALQNRGLDTLATVGGFWEDEQVADLLAYLGALANPLDELALYGTLASPLVGVSSDGLALLGRAAKAGRRSVWETLARIGDGDSSEIRLPAADRERLVAFRARLLAERATAGRWTLSQSIGRALDQSGYAEHVLTLSGGGRRLANVHKLLRVARRYEASEGRELRGFLDHVAHHKDGLSGAEPDAPVAAGETEAVRLMSIHAAKGLEFDVVCVADLGRAQNLGVGDLLVDGGRVGVRLARLDGSEATPALAWMELAEERRLAQAEEEDRILYVAMTRARERLLLSGAVDLEGWPQERLGAPTIAWLGPALSAELPASVQTLQPPIRELAIDVSDGTSVRVGLRLNAPATAGVLLRLDEPPGGDDGGDPDSQPARADTVAGGGGGERERLAPRARLAPLAPLAQTVDIGEGPADRSRHGRPVPAGDRARLQTLSYTSLTELARCSYRFYLERVLGLPEQSPPVGAGGESRGDGLEARVRGTIVHRLLESLDFPPTAAPSAGDVARVARELRVRVAPEECEELAALLRAALDTPMAARLAAVVGGARREHPFALALVDPDASRDGVLLTGVLDLLAREPDGAMLVVDYKSDLLAPGEDLEAVVEREYSIQRLLYALAVLSDGAPSVEIVHWFLHRPAEPIGVVFAQGDRPRLEDAVARLVGNARGSSFAVSEDPHRGLCVTCPGRSGMCSWSDSMTLREQGGPVS